MVLFCKIDITFYGGSMSVKLFLLALKMLRRPGELAATARNKYRLHQLCNKSIIPNIQFNRIGKGEELNSLTIVDDGGIISRQQITACCFV
jgi:hypothetical protein